MWCLTTGQPPAVFRELTRLERRTFYETARRLYAAK